MDDTLIETRGHFVSRWIKGTFVGWLLGLLTLPIYIGIWEILANISYQSYRDNAWHSSLSGTPGDVIFALLSLGTLFSMGVAMGLAQWQIALKGKVNKRAWLTASGFSFVTGVTGLIIGGQISPALVAFHDGVFSGFDTLVSVNSTWPITVVILGSFVGIALSFPRWLILRSRFHKAYHWLLAEVAGAIAALVWSIAIVFVLHNVMISSTLVCGTGPLVFAAVTGVGLFNLLQRAKQP